MKLYIWKGEMHIYTQRYRDRDNGQVDRRDENSCCIRKGRKDYYASI